MRNSPRCEGARLINFAHGSHCGFRCRCSCYFRCAATCCCWQFVGVDVALHRRALFSPSTNFLLCCCCCCYSSFSICLTIAAFPCNSFYLQSSVIIFVAIVNMLLLSVCALPLLLLLPSLQVMTVSLPSRSSLTCSFNIGSYTHTRLLNCDL